MSIITLFNGLKNWRLGIERTSRGSQRAKLVTFKRFARR
jgi:hypothetical protein